MKHIRKFNKVNKYIFYILTLSIFIFSTVSCGSTPQPETTQKNEDEILLEKVDDELLIPDEEISIEDNLISEEINSTNSDKENFVNENDNLLQPENYNPEDKTLNSLEEESQTDTKNISINNKSEDNVIINSVLPSEEIKETLNNSNPTEKAQVKEETNVNKDASTNNEISENSSIQSNNNELTDTINNELLENDEKSEENNNTKNEEVEIIIPSRSVTVAVNQYLDIIYPGSGWIYLGETNEEPTLRYFGRKINESDTRFTLKARNEGTTIAHFYKNDALTGTFIDDYIEIIVSGLHGKEERVTAPSYADTVPPRLQDNSNSKTISNQNNNETKELLKSTDNTKESFNNSKTDDTSKAITSDTSNSPLNSVSGKQATVQPEENVPTVIQTTENQSQIQTLSKAKENSESKKEISKDMNAEELIGLANSSFAENKYEDALEYLNSFFNIAVNRIDEGLFLQGQILESNSFLRNIKAALDSYETLIKMYPQSEYWQKANERIIYLNRFYFNIR